jgi:ribosome-binding factor A
MDAHRSERLSEAIREELDELISYELSDPRIDTAGVAEVAVSPDGRTARVRVLLPGDAASNKQCLDALNGAKSYIRRELTRRIEIYRIPELYFEAAVSVELGSKLEHLLKRVRRGRPRPDAAPAAEPRDSAQLTEDKLVSQKKPVP